MLRFVFKTLTEGGGGEDFLRFMENNENFKSSLGFKSSPHVPRRFKRNL